jgi:hypothetical protein
MIHPFARGCLAGAAANGIYFAARTSFANGTSF